MLGKREKGTGRTPRAQGTAGAVVAEAVAPKVPRVECSWTSRASTRTCMGIGPLTRARADTGPSSPGACWLSWSSSASSCVWRTGLPCATRQIAARRWSGSAFAGLSWASRDTGATSIATLPLLPPRAAKMVARMGRRARLCVTNGRVAAPQPSLRRQARGLRLTRAGASCARSGATHPAPHGAHWAVRVRCTRTLCARTARMRRGSSVTRAVAPPRRVRQRPMPSGLLEALHSARQPLWLWASARGRPPRARRPQGPSRPSGRAPAWAPRRVPPQRLGSISSPGPLAGSSGLAVEAAARTARAFLPRALACTAAAQRTQLLQAREAARLLPACRRGAWTARTRTRARPPLRAQGRPSAGGDPGEVRRPGCLSCLPEPPQAPPYPGSARRRRWKQLGRPRGTTGRASGLS
mmetsp:Transcript_5348/g.15669  ORF Transcript_5348/g.15669 Transcript_5348/m.15669 type:complete len:410 (+) Transcript_5348:705-1934(+)